MRRDGPELPADLSLGKAIIFLRRQAGMPQHELTRRLGLSARSNVSDYELERRVPPRDIVAACEQIFGLHDGELQLLRRRMLEERARISALSSLQAAPQADAEPMEAEPAESELPAAGPAPASRPRRRARRAAIAASVLVVLIASVATRMAFRQQVPMASIRTDSTVPQPVSSAFRDHTHHDGDDPAVTGCSQDVVTLTQTVVRLPGGAVFGRLLLRHSPACDMSWGSVWGQNPRLYRVYISARRPSDQAVEASSWAGNTPPGSYGNMLSTLPGCVEVSAYVQTATGNGPMATTSCER